MKPRVITTVLEKDTDGTWCFIHVPKKVRDSYKSLEKRDTIPITIKAGNTAWQASMLPWADGSAQVSVNKQVREKENLKPGQHITVEIKPRER